MNKIFFTIQSGQSLMELLLAVGLLAIVLPAMVLGLVSSRDGKAQQNQRLQAVALVKEAEESLRVIRDSGWSAVQNNGTFHPAVAGNTWILASNSAIVNGFTIKVEISDVSRDTNGTIASSGGTLDPSTKKIVTTVSWTQPYSSSISQTSYLTRHESLSYTDTTQTNFDAGTKTNTFTTNSSGGEVTLGAGGGGGDWCIPSKSITTFDLPKSGVANAVAAIEGTIFAGTGGNASGVSFQKISLSTTQDPPIVTGGATFDGYKTNVVFGESGYAYLGTDSNSKEIVMMSLSQYTNPPTNTKYLEVGSINLPGNGSGNGIYVLNNKAYTTTSSGNKLYIYDITNRAVAYGNSGTPQELNTGGLTLSGTPKKVIVIDLPSISKTYAFVMTSATTNQLQIVDVTTASSPTIVGQKTLGSNQAGVDLFVNATGTRAYVVTSYAVGKQNFYVVNTSTKSSPVTVGSGYNTSGMNPTGLTVVTGNRAIIVGTGGTQQYQVVNISNELSPFSCAGLPYSTGVNGVASVLQSNGFAYSYIITGDASSELKIILGGAGGQYSSAGTFESAVYNPGFLTAYNVFQATVSQPAQTEVKLQIAVAKAVNGNCTGITYKYVGPNGDPSQYFTLGTNPTLIQGAVPLMPISGSSYENPGQCFKYKMSLTTSDSTATPELYDMTVNYSP